LNTLLSFGRGVVNEPERSWAEWVGGLVFADSWGNYLKLVGLGRTG